MRALLVAVLAFAACLVAPSRSSAENLEPGVWLEMAVLACQRGEPGEMERLLQGLERRFAPPPGVVRLISSLRQSGCGKPNQVDPPSALEAGPEQPRSRLAIGLGATSNVNAGPSVEVLSLSGLENAQLVLDESYRPKPDAWLSLSAEHEFSIGLLTRHGLSTGVSATGRWLRSEQDFQELLWGGWLRGQWQIGPMLTLGSGLSLASSRLGQKAYADHAQWSAQLQWGAAQDWRADLSFHQARYAQREAFDAAVSQLGISHDLRLPIFSRSQARLAAVSDQGQAERPGGDRAGWIIQWSGERQALPRGLWTARLHLERSLSRDPYSPGLIEERRDHKISRVELGWLLTSGSGQFWRLALSHRLERDAISLLGMRETSLGLEFNRVF